MDPITISIVAALAAGVGGGVAEVGKKVIVDAYTALTTALKKKHGVDSELADAVEKLEKKPDSPSRQGMVAEEVATAKAADDPQLQKLAQELIQALKSTPEGEKVVGKFQIDATGAQIGIVGDNAKVEGGMHFG